MDFLLQYIFTYKVPKVLLRKGVAFILECKCNTCEADLKWIICVLYISEELSWFGSFEAHFSCLHLNLLHTTLNTFTSHISSSHLVTETGSLFPSKQLDSLLVYDGDIYFPICYTVFKEMHLCCLFSAKSGPVSLISAPL